MSNPGSPEAIAAQRTFFSLAFGRGTYEGYFCIAFLAHGGKKQFWERWYHYPTELPEAVDEINRQVLQANIYFCPQLFAQKKRKKEFVKAAPTVWADLDTCHPDLLEVKPSVIIQSSPSRFQALWRVQNMEIPDAESMSRRIAYAHAEDGCDRSGWDLTQLLRVPGTFNYKYGQFPNHPAVSVLEGKTTTYRLEDFPYEEVPEYQYDKYPYPDREALEGMEAEAVLMSRGRMLPPAIWTLFHTEPEEDWSKPLWNLQMILAEYGFTREEALVVSREAKCNKYARDGRSDQLLWSEVCRAFSRAQHTSELLKAPQGPEATALLSEEERARVQRMQPTFIEHYIDWAKTTGDAAHQYHQAGAFVALSTLLSGNLVLPTSFGTIVPNLWFMILADTTLTRKTTAMDLAMDLITEVDADALLATDGSVEGLMTSLAMRPERPSVFLRDEFSGLLEAMGKKDYLAGMPEVLTKLYDGKSQKRLLRKETVDVRNPRLIIFAGGIKNKVTSILTHEQVSSGFMPRFVFITAESDVNRVKPLGPPTIASDNGRAAIVAALQDIAGHYQQTDLVEVPSTISGSVTPTKMPQRKRYDARLTDRAWIRYNGLEHGLLQQGLNTEFLTEILTPTYDRLAKSILKAAVLLAASVQRTDEVVVDEEHILRAISYGEQWKSFADEIITQVGRSSNEHMLDKIIRTLRNHPQGMMRSKLMQWHHLDARTTSALLDTLEQRNAIVRRKHGRGELLLITEYGAVHD
jgi:hypothetical protein